MLLPALQGRQGIDARVNPELQLWKLPGQPPDDRELVRSAAYGIEVGDIQAGERVQLHQAAYDSERITGTGQDALQQRVGFADATPGMHYLAAGDINNRNNYHN